MGDIVNGPSEAFTRRREGLHIAVVGGGYWGSKHVRVLSSMPGVGEVTVVEREAERRQALVDSFPWIHGVEQLDQVLDRCDGVIVATRSGTHVDLGLAAIRAGKGVLIEKPLATSLADADLLCEEADARGVVLMCGHTFVFNPVVVELRKRIEAGELGKVHYLRSMRLNLGLYQSDVNVIWDLAPHDVSIMNHLLDDVPTQVTAWAQKASGADHEDIGAIRLQYERSGVEGYINVSWLDPSKTREVTVVGSKRMAVYDDVNVDERLRIYERSVTNPSGRLHEAPMSYRYGSITSPYIDFAEPLALEDGAFVEAIGTGVVPKADGREGRDVVAVLEAASRSVESGFPEKVAADVISGGRALDREAS